MSYALVAGFDQFHQKHCPETEVMYVNGTTKICRSTANYPEIVGGLSGCLFLKNDLIVACGGKIPSPHQKLITSACYSMSKHLKWTHFANLTEPKFLTVSVIVKNGLWVTGTKYFVVSY